VCVFHLLFHLHVIITPELSNPFFFWQSVSNDSANLNAPHFARTVLCYQDCHVIPPPFSMLMFPFSIAGKRMVSMLCRCLFTVLYLSAAIVIFVLILPVYYGFFLIVLANISLGYPFYFVSGRHHFNTLVMAK